MKLGLRIFFNFLPKHRILVGSLVFLSLYSGALYTFATTYVAPGSTLDPSGLPGAYTVGPVLSYGEAVTTGHDNEVLYVDGSGDLASDSLFTRASTGATVIAQSQNSGVDVAEFIVDDNLLGVPGTSGVGIRRYDEAASVGSAVFYAVDASPLGAPTDYALLGRVQNIITGFNSQLVLLPTTSILTTGNSTETGVLSLQDDDFSLKVTDSDGGGNYDIGFRGDLNDYEATTFYEDGTYSFGIRLNNAGVTFDYDGFSGNAGTFYIFPISDGTNGQVLTTDGAGTVTWESVGAGSASLTDKYIGFGDSSNVLTGDADFIYTDTFSLVTHTVPNNSDSLSYSTASFTGSGLDDLTLTWNSSIYASNKYGGNLTITIDTTGSPDTFNWYFTGGYSQTIGSGTSVAITGGVQTLNDADGNKIAEIQFGATTGHTASDQWIASTSLGGNQKGYLLGDSLNHEFLTVNPGGGTYRFGDDGTNGGSQWWGGGTNITIQDNSGELGLYAPRYLRFEHPTVGTYTAALVDMQNQIWDTYGRFRVKDLADAVWFEVLSASGITNIGDVQNVANGTRVLVDDTAQQVTVSAQSGFLVEGAQGGNQWLNVATTAGIVQIGDLSGTSNSVTFEVNDSASTMTGTLDGVFTLQNVAGADGFVLDTANKTSQLGFISGAGINGNYFLIDDANHDSRIVTDSSGYFAVKGGSNVLFQVNASGQKVTVGDVLNAINETKFTVDDPNQIVTISSVNSAGSVFSVTNSDGTCTLDPGDVSGLSCPSDMNLKKEITSLSDGVLSQILALRPVTYRLNNESDDTALSTGLIAQEVQTIFPTLVKTQTDGTLSLNYGGLTPFMIKAIQELDLKISPLEDLLTENNSVAESLRTFLSNAQNKITRIFTGEICLYEEGQQTECITRSELHDLKLLLSTSGSGGTAGVSGGTGSPIPNDSDTVNGDDSGTGEDSGDTDTGDTLGDDTTGGESTTGESENNLNSEGDLGGSGSVPEPSTE